MAKNNAIPEGESSEEGQEVSLRDQILAAKEEIEAPNDREPKPNDREPKPNDREPKPNDREPKPNDREPKPNGTDKPTEPEHQPPNSWTADAKAKWADIPSEARAYIARREADMHKAITAQDELKTAGKAIRELVQPYGDLFAEMPGVAPPALIKGYLDTEKTLRRGTPEQKAQLIGNVIKSYGLDLNILNQVLQQNAPPPQPDPRLNTLEQRIAQFEAQQQATQDEQKLSIIQKFMGDNGLDEAVINDDFLAEVSFTKGKNPNLGEREILDKAWERYQWANPETRLALIGKQKQETGKQDAINRARRAGASVTGSPGTGTETDKPAESLRDELKRQFGRANGRL